MNAKRLFSLLGFLYLTCAPLAVLPSEASAAKKAKGNKLTTEDFFRYDQNYNFALSRDGEKVSYVMRKGNKTYLNIYDLKKKSTNSIYIDNHPELFVNHLEWCSADRLVLSKYYLGVFVGGGGIYGVDSNGKNARMLLKWESQYGFDPYILDMLVHDPRYILVEVLNRRAPSARKLTSAIYKLNVYNGESELVYDDLRGIYGWTTDQNGELRAGLEYHNRVRKLRFRDTDSNKWILIDNFLGEESRIKFDYDAEALTNRHCTLLGFDYDPNIVYFGSNLDKDTMGIYAYDLSRKEIRETIAEHADFDLVETDSSRDMRILRFNPVKRSLVGIDTYFNDIDTLWFDPDYQAVQDMVNGTFPGKRNYIQDWNDEAKVFLVNSAASNDPGKYYVLDLEKTQLTEIGAMRPWIDPSTMSPKIPFLIESRDGFKLHGYLTVPVSMREKPLPMNLPMVVYPHGGPWARDYADYEKEVQFLAYHGYAVLQVNYRGSTGYGFKHFDGARRDFGIGILNDITDCVHWAVENGVADPKRVAIMGGSYGGYAAMMSLTHNPGLYRCGVSIAGVFDLRKQMVNYVAGTRRAYFAYDYWKSMVGDPKLGREKMEEISPVNHVEKLQDTVLIIHGEHDNVVSIGQSQALVRELKKANKPYEYMPVKEEGHGGWKEAAAVEIYDQVLAFLDRHLK